MPSWFRRLSYYSAMDNPRMAAGVHPCPEGSCLVLRFSGIWSTQSFLPEVGDVLGRVANPEQVATIEPVLEDGIQYDSSLASFLFELIDLCATRNWEMVLSALPADLVKLVKLAQQAGQTDDSVADSKQKSNWLDELGSLVIKYLKGALEIATFTGDWIIALLNLLRGRATIRWDDFWHIMRTVSVDALPIVALISFLVGVIISFLGAVTLKQFGAEFAVAYLIGFGILREMGAIMTGVIMAGRSGAAFAAQIGSMKINEEIDALKTLGISPIEFIVLPRLLALFIMMPLLTLYSNVIGILSGWLVAEGLMGVPGPVFFTEMQSVLYIGDFLLGIFKASVFGILVATAGCLRGLQSGSGADAVGVAATRAVVAGITLIVFSNAVIDWAAATIGI